ncbi:MAG: MoaD/ThiS family protein [Deltaproteobacteria bacterium]|nr:MoaD/ThiS family protein [Candidatus Dadabacteria bacterium]TDJ06836.1 MAG: MoaD/ThiS family protein [Deltaproteobacteria bacterium]
MPSVRIPTPLRRLTGEKDEVDINASNVAELIEELENQFPGIKERLCDENGEVRRFINLYVNNEDIRFLDGVSTGLNKDDIVSIIPAIAGGVVN